jgi:trigger factor
MKAGESRQVRVTFPDTYRAQELAGKEAVFDVTVHEIKRAVLPDLNDEFVRQISDKETVAALRDDVRRRLEAVAQARSNEDVQRQLLDALVERNDVPLPDVLVEREIDNLISDAKSYMQRIGRSWDEYLAAKNVDDAGLRKEYRVEAERRVKTALLLEEVAKREKIEVTTADVDQELDAMAHSYGQTRESVIDFLRKTGGFGPIIDTVSRRKTLDLLVANATITDVAAVAQTIS